MHEQPTSTEHSTPSHDDVDEFWSEALNLGIETLDGQHRFLLEMFSQALTAFGQEIPEKVLEDVLGGLVAYTVVHFESEERLMKDAAYPQLGHHLQEHRALREQVERLRQGHKQDALADAQELTAFLRNWITEHILKDDRAFADFLKTQQ